MASAMEESAPQRRSVEGVDGCGPSLASLQEPAVDANANPAVAPSTCPSGRGTRTSAGHSLLNWSPAQAPVTISQSLLNSAILKSATTKAISSTLIVSPDVVGAGGLSSQQLASSLLGNGNYVIQSGGAPAQFVGVTSGTAAAGSGNVLQESPALFGGGNYNTGNQKRNSLTSGNSLLDASPRAQFWAKTFSENFKKKKAARLTKGVAGNSAVTKTESRNSGNETAASTKPAERSGEGRQDPATVSRLAAYRRSTTFHATELDRLRTRDDGCVQKNDNALKKHASMEDEVWDPFDNSDSDSDDRRETLAEILGDLRWEGDQFNIKEKLPRLLPDQNLNLVNTFDFRGSICRMRRLQNSPKSDRRLRQKIVARLERHWLERRRQQRRDVIERKRRAEEVGLNKIVPKATTDTGHQDNPQARSSSPANGTGALALSSSTSHGGTTSTTGASSEQDDDEGQTKHPYMDPPSPTTTEPGLEIELHAPDLLDDDIFQQLLHGGKQSKKSILQTRVDTALDQFERRPSRAVQRGQTGLVMAPPTERISARKRPPRSYVKDHRMWWQNLPFDMLPKEHRREERIRRRRLERGKIALDTFLTSSTAARASALPAT